MRARALRIAATAMMPLLFGFILVAIGGAWSASSEWSTEESAEIRSLSLAALPPLPVDPSNRVADDPRAAALGERLFFDMRFSANGKVACASCHLPAKQFQDGLPLGRGIGTTARRTMPIAGTAWSPWMFWDGRKDSQWSQALGPLESAVEHGGDRTMYVRLVAQHYRAQYERIFGPLPDMSGLPAHAGPVSDSAAAKAWRTMPAEQRERISRAFAGIGKAIAAYERRLVPRPTRFDRYAAAVAEGRRPGGNAALSSEEAAGLRLFIGRAQCVRCHNGPRLTDDHFHNTGVPEARGVPRDEGRADGIRHALDDEFNCLGRYSDARESDCGELRFAVDTGEALVRAFKTPSLRDVAARAPYMHAGQFGTLDEVVAHYAAAPASVRGRTELEPLRLTARERRALVAFLRTLAEEAEPSGR